MIDNTHGGSSNFKDPGVIVEYDCGFINNIITATKDVTVPVMGGSVAAITGAAKFGETLTADVSGITYTQRVDNVPTTSGIATESLSQMRRVQATSLTTDDMGAAITVNGHRRRYTCDRQREQAHQLVR